jgi:flagellar hook-length control protein FliK
MKIQIESTRKEILGESLMKKSVDSTYGDFGNAFQTQMNHVLEETNSKYSLRMQIGFNNYSSANSQVQNGARNTVDKTKTISFKNRLHKNEDMADRHLDRKNISSKANEDRGYSLASSPKTASTYDDDDQRPVDSSAQKYNSDQTGAASSDDSKTLSNDQFNERDFDDPDRAKEQGSAPLAAASESVSESAQETADAIATPSTESASVQENTGMLLTLQGMEPKDNQEILAAETCSDKSISTDGLATTEETNQASLFSTLQVSQKLGARNPKAVDTIYSSIASPAESLEKETINDQTAKGNVPSALLSIGASSENEMVKDFSNSRSDATPSAEGASAAAADLALKAGARQIAPELEGRVQKPFSSAASGKSRKVFLDAKDKSLDLTAVSGENANQPIRMGKALMDDSTLGKDASDAKSFTDALMQNQGEPTRSFKSGEGCDASELVQSIANNNASGAPSSVSDELLLQVSLKDHQESTVPSVNAKPQNAEFKLDAVVPSGNSLENTLLSGKTVGNLTQQSSIAQPKEFILQVGDRIQSLIMDRKGAIRIQLKPENLGQMEIRAENTASGVIAKITTGSRDVSNLLEANMHLLQQSIQDQGLKVDRINILVQQGFDASGSLGYNAQSGSTGSESNGQAAQAASGSDAASTDSQSEDVSSELISRTALNPNIRFHRIA